MRRRRRRQPRILLNAATVVSLVLCAATAALWVRSYWRRDTVRWARYVRETEVARHEEEGAWIYKTVDVDSNRGRVLVERGSLFSPVPEYPTWTHAADDPYRPPPAETFWKRVGFERYTTTDGGGTGVALPYWIVALAFALPPTAALIGRLALRRRAGLCPGCGYDLRATPARCPECGAVPPPTPTPPPAA